MEPMLGALSGSRASPNALAPPFEPCSERGPSFAEFDRRARSGDELSVVFFGGSLTWGAQASEPDITSYRGLIGKQLGDYYPNARFTFRDAAIGGTASNLGAFRLDRDVLRHKPDLVFLDFSVNDDLFYEDRDRLSSFEAIIRRLIDEAQCCVVQVILPTQASIEVAEIADLRLRTAHRWIGQAYRTAVADAVQLARERMALGWCSLHDLWPTEDKVHPTDCGYRIYAEAAWTALQARIEDQSPSVCPERPLYDDTYLKPVRQTLASLPHLPSGWQICRPSTSAAYFDMLMSRWLDDVLVIDNGTTEMDGAGKCAPSAPRDSPHCLRVEFCGTTAILFGESTPNSGAYLVSIDGGSPVSHDAGALARTLTGNAHLVQVLASGLDPARRHVVEIAPVFSGTQPQELRLESLCIAGAGAAVML